MALNIERIEKKWEPSQLVIASYAEVLAENENDKTVSIKLIDGQVRAPNSTSDFLLRENANTTIDFFADQTGFINLLVYPANDAGINKTWIRIEANEFFRAVGVLRESVVLTGENNESRTT